MNDFENTALRWTGIVVTGIEVLAVIITVVVIVTATVLFLSRRFSRNKPKDTYHKYRVGLPRAILLGLEVLIAAVLCGLWSLTPLSRVLRFWDFWLYFGHS